MKLLMLPVPFYQSGEYDLRRERLRGQVARKEYVLLVSEEVHCMFHQATTAQEALSGGRGLRGGFACSCGQPSSSRSIPEGSPSLGGPPPKGVNKEYKGFFPNFSLKFWVLKLRFFVFSEGPGGFRELREAYRNRLHLSWYLPISVRDREL